MSTTSPPGTQQSLTDALQAAAGREDTVEPQPDAEPLPPAAPAEWLVSADVTAAIDAGLMARRVFPPARPRRWLIPNGVGRAIDGGLLHRDWTDCGHDDIWMESGSCMACEPAWQTPAERESREELDINRQPEDFA